jgi:methylmalonyl-CoA/ethylmalonyl-CoA epimerase
MEKSFEKGFRPLSEKTKKGADNKRIVFLHPKTTNNVLVELCEDQPLQ